MLPAANHRIHLLDNGELVPLLVGDPLGVRASLENGSKRIPARGLIYETIFVQCHHLIENTIGVLRFLRLVWLRVGSDN